MKTRLNATKWRCPYCSNSWLWNGISREPFGALRSVMARCSAFFTLFHFNLTFFRPEVPFKPIFHQVESRVLISFHSYSLLTASRSEKRKFHCMQKNISRRWCFHASNGQTRGIYIKHDWQLIILKPIIFAKKMLQASHYWSMLNTCYLCIPLTKVGKPLKKSIWNSVKVKIN